MNAAALGTNKVRHWTGKSRAHHEHRQRMAGRQFADALLPVLKGAARLIWPYRRLIESDRLADVRGNGFRRQHEDKSFANPMPARASDDSDALTHANAAEIFGKVLLLRAVDPQPLFGERGAERGRFALQRRVGHMAHVHAFVIVPKAHLFTPRAAMRIAASAKDFERRAEPNRFDGRVIASPDLNLLREPVVDVHREGAIRDIGRRGGGRFGRARRYGRRRRRHEARVFGRLDNGADSQCPGISPPKRRPPIAPAHRCALRRHDALSPKLEASVAIRGL